MSIATIVLAQEVKPEQIYDGGDSNGTSPILLRIGNGGAGQSGLVKGLYLSNNIHGGLSLTLFAQPSRMHLSRTV